MAAHHEFSPELTPEAEYPGSITPLELVDLIAQAGPGANLKVLSHHLTDGLTTVGQTTYQSDFTKGPAIYRFDDPRKQDWISGILPLGSETTVIGPPRFNALGDRRVMPSILAGHPNIVHTKPIDPYVDGKYRFTVLTDEEFAAEEASLIEFLEEQEALQARREQLGLELANTDSSTEKVITGLSDDDRVQAWLKAGKPATALTVALGITELTDHNQIKQIEKMNQDAQKRGPKTFADQIRLLLLSLMKEEDMELEKATELLVEPIFDESAAFASHPYAKGHSLLEIYAVSPESYDFRLARYFHPGYRTTAT